MSEGENQFPDEMFLVVDDCEACSHMGHPELTEAAQQLLTNGEGWVCKYKRIGKPFQVSMENRQQHRVMNADGKAITPWTTWEGDDE
jgi:hypothetical protein